MSVGKASRPRPPATAQEPPTGDTSTHCQRALRPTWLALRLIAAVVLIAGVVGLVWGVRRVVEYGSNPATEPLAQPVATMIAAFGVILASVIAFVTGVLHRNVEQSKVALDRDKHMHDRQESERTAVIDGLRDLRSRYSSAAEQLGHQNPTIRQAGAHSLAALTDDWHTFETNHPQQSTKGARMCLKLLVSYLGTRNAYPDGHSLKASKPGRWAGPDGAVRATILTLLESGLALSQGSSPWSKIDLRSADLRGVDLAERIFVHLDFSHADLTGADLQRAVFARDMAGTRLSQSNAGGASFAETTWNGVNASKANLDFALMHGMRIRGNSDFSEASMRRTNLEHTQILPNTGLRDVDLALARVDKRTQFPTDVVNALNVSYIPLLGETDLASFAGDDGLNDLARTRWELWIELSRARFGTMSHKEGKLAQFDWASLAMKYANSPTQFWSDEGLQRIDDDAADRNPGFTDLLSAETETSNPAWRAIQAASRTSASDGANLGESPPKQDSDSG